MGEPFYIYIVDLPIAHYEDSNRKKRYV